MNALIIFFAQYVLFIIPVIGLYALYRTPRAERRRFIMTGIIAVIVGFILLTLASKLFYNPRPFMVKNVVPLFAHSASNGFPSDHMTAATLMGLVVALFNRRLGIIILVLAVCIGSARVMAHVHSWLDIFGAIVVASLAAAAAWCAYHLIAKRSAQLAVIESAEA